MSMKSKLQITIEDCHCIHSLHLKEKFTHCGSVKDLCAVYPPVCIQEFAASAALLPIGNLGVIFTQALSVFICACSAGSSADRSPQ